MPTQSILIYLNSSQSTNTDNFTIRDCFGNVLATGVTRTQLISGYNVVIDTLCGTYSITSDDFECPNVTRNFLIPYRWFFFGNGGFAGTSSTSPEACFRTPGGEYLWENSTIMAVGLSMSSDPDLTIRFASASTHNGGGWYTAALYRTGAVEYPIYAVRMNSLAEIIEVVDCTGVTTTTTTTTTTAAPPPPPPSPSDFSLKRNINLIGKSENGINIYSFNYNNDFENTYQGVIAQELIGTEFEDAISIDERGYYQVDYSKIDVEFKKI